MIATLVKHLKDWTGDARLFSVVPPVIYSGDKTSEYVVVSATVAPFSGPEIYIFPSDKNGEVLNWTELTGSRRGTLDHEQVLRDAGYKVVK